MGSTRPGPDNVRYASGVADNTAPSPDNPSGWPSDHPNFESIVKPLLVLLILVSTVMVSIGARWMDSSPSSVPLFCMSGGEGVRDTSETLSSLSSALSPWSALGRWGRKGREKGSTACAQRGQEIWQSTFIYDATSCSSSCLAIGTAFHRAIDCADMGVETAVRVKSVRFTRSVFLATVVSGHRSRDIVSLRVAALGAIETVSRHDELRRLLRR